MSPLPIDDLDYLLRHKPIDDPSVVEALVGRYHPPLYRLAYSILGDPDEAAAAAQESLITASLKLDQYQPGTNFRAWLYAIALNTLRGRLRRRRSLPGVPRWLGGAPFPAARPPGPEEAAVMTETHAELWDAIDGLDEKHRLALLLRIVHQVPVREIAHILGIREKTVYTRLYTAFGRIRAKMNTRFPRESAASKSV